ncbi:hypothetical protein NUW46_13250 [Marinobacter sp. MA]|uniref:hypothetical protein n=1 Tax=Marinobacter sp. MA TaxID=2971606 RepID=UPI003AAB132D
MSIPSLEKKLFTNQLDAFKEELFSLLDDIEKGKVVLGGERLLSDGKHHRASGIYPMALGRSMLDNQASAQRLALCITAFLTSPNLTLSHQQILKFILYKTHLTDIFYLSDFGNLDHILQYRDLWSETNGFQLKSDSDVFLMLICWTLNSRIKPPFDVLLRQVPQECFHTFVAAFYQLEQIQTPEGFENFDLAFNSFLSLPDNINISVCTVMLVNIWMGCSYWDTPRRHQIKAKINRIISANFPKMPEVPFKKALPRKPRVAVLVERYRSEHAMYRCYHARIAPLKDAFVTCLFSVSGDVDPTSQSDLHSYVQVSNNPADLKKTARKIIEFQPDIIIYPSLGMNVWTVLLANFRLAPVQVMGYGHPASAMTDTIDFGFLSGMFEGPDYQRWCIERLIPFYGEIGHTTLHPELNPQLRSRAPSESDTTIRIAINSSLMKISDRVLQVCRMLRENSTKSLEFHFFPAHNRGFKLLAFERKLIRALGGGITVHEPQPYCQYMEQLADCHFAIGTFPFGGANTNIDSILLEQPKVYLEPQDDLASYTDSNNFKRYDSQAGFVCGSEFELIGQAIIWIHNHREFHSAKQRVSKMRSTFMNTIAQNPSDQRSYSFVNSIQNIIELSN